MKVLSQSAGLRPSHDQFRLSSLDWRANCSSRQDSGRRKRNEESKKRLQDFAAAGAAPPTYIKETFSKEQITAEDRKPKRKVAVMLGYSGKGYKGMQISPTEKTIEGDLFAAFVAAGAISKANADDPKKSSLVRCARTDKGVHAAGNVISLKLIVEDADIVSKINEHLPPQIRVWGIERAIGSFSCYQACDSRWYEYLIPTHSFLPPPPSSYLAQQMVKLAEEVGDVEGHNERQKDVANFWSEIEQLHTKPILESLDEETRALIEKALNAEATTPDFLNELEDSEYVDDDNADIADALPQKAVEAHISIASSASDTRNAIGDAGLDKAAGTEDIIMGNAESDGPKESAAKENPKVAAAISALRAAYIAAKRQYRISPARRQRVAEGLAQYVGTNNFHNFTIRKAARDPSAKRHIKSFTASEPMIINETEWLSLKVHGQSFMMHQIRKMVGMVAMLVRCGAPLERLTEAMTLDTVNIPKAPACGLLLERPVFDNYNAKATSNFNREPIDFAKYDEHIEAFKQAEIYSQMYQAEERENA